MKFDDKYYDESAHYAHMKEVFVGGLEKLGLKYMTQWCLLCAC
ncbi:MAG: hypothetical protein ACLT33_08535 [Lachnospira pectinoschiza]